MLVISAGILGLTAGAHRLWAHRAYRARWPLRLLLAIFQTTTLQNHIYWWARDHRLHHKFTDTDADPYNSSRGFFFSQIGWLLLRKHKDVTCRGKTIDTSDLEKDWVVMWQKRMFPYAMPFMCFVIPTCIPIYLWGEKPWVAWYVAGVGRCGTLQHITFLVNSVAHIWGRKPYNRNVSSVENVSIAYLTFGEGWHNYHHAFPWDYKAAELGGCSKNFTTAFIDFFAKIGWAYELKIVTPEIVKRKVLRTGDGTHFKYCNHEGEIWGWDDKDVDPADKAMAKVIRKNCTD